MTYQISQNGINLIKRWEGCQLQSYQDSVGVWTIGYGHTKGISSGMTISQAQADAYLKNDIQSHVTGVYSYVTVPLTQNQFDALASFHFNLGANILKGSTLLTYINSQQWGKAGDNMLEYCHAGGKRLEGLYNRRVAERALFLTASPVASKGASKGVSSTNTTKKEVITMVCIYWKPNAKNTGNDAYFFDGTKVHYIGNFDSLKLLRQIYKDNNGKDMPEYKWTNAAPWWIRLDQALK